MNRGLFSYVSKTNLAYFTCFLLKPADILKTLTCRYKRGKLPYVVYKEEVLSWDPRISTFYDVISNDEVQLIKQLATPKVGCVLQ